MGNTITWRILLATLVGLLTGLGVASAASAAAPWLAPVTIAGSAATPLSQPAIASAPDGTTYAIWVRSDGTNQRIWIASRRPGGAFGAPGASPSPAGQNADTPKIAVDRQGNVTALWRRCDGSVCVVQAAYRPTAGSWQPAVDISDTSSTASSPELAVGDHGNAIAVWQRTDAGVPRVEATVRPSGAGFFTNRSFISPASGTSMCPPRAAMDAAGDAVVLWQRLYDGDGAGSGVATWTMESNERAAGGSFSVAAVRSQSATVQSTTSTYIGALSCTYDVAMAPGGNTLAIWDYANGGTTPGSKFVEFAERVGSSFGSGSWSGRARASAPNQDAEVPSVALDDAGNAVGTWSAYDGSAWNVQGATRDAFGAWGDRIDLSGPGAGAFQSSLAASPRGDALIVWPGTSGADSAIIGARRQPGSAFAGLGPAAIGHGSSDPYVSYSSPSVAMDDQGNAFAAYVKQVTQGTTTTYSLQAAGMDPVAPAVTRVIVPGSGVTGSAVPMSAGVSDRMSTPSVSWTFGDGGTATGASVGHAYAAPGTYTVTVTATDRAGNRSSQSRTITVSNPTPPGSGGGTPGGGGTPPVTVPKLVGAKLATGWSVKGTKLTLTELTFKKLPTGWTAKVTCSGTKCPFTSKKLKNKKVRSGKWNALKALGTKHTFRAGQTLEVRIGAPNRSTKVLRFALKKNTTPKAATLCLPPGAKKPAKSCS